MAKASIVVVVRASLNRDLKVKDKKACPDRGHGRRVRELCQG